MTKELSPQEYFNRIKNLRKHISTDELKDIYENCLELAIKYFPKFKKSIEVSKSIHMQYPMDDEIRTIEYVENECKHLADQLKSFENYEFTTKED